MHQTYITDVAYLLTYRIGYVTPYTDSVVNDANVLFMRLFVNLS